MQFVLIVAIQYMTVFNPISGQRFVLDISKYITPCSKHLRSDKDAFLLSARLGDNLMHLMSVGWQNVVTFQVPTRTPAVFQDICQIVIDPARCGDGVVSGCHCQSIAATNRDTVMFVSFPAKELHGNGLVRGVWRHKNGTSIYSDFTSSEHIFDVSTAILNFTVKVANKSATKEVTKSCVLNVVAGLDNTLTVCCSNTAQPCYPYIHLGRGILSNNRSTCSKYNFTPRDGVTLNATVLYSVCSRTEYIEKGSCTLTTERDKDGTLYIIPISLTILMGCLLSCWFIVVILYVYVKIFKPLKDNRKRSANPSEYPTDGLDDAPGSVVTDELHKPESAVDSIHNNREVNAVKGDTSEKESRNDIHESTDGANNQTIER